jgi:hypothetical protein
MMSDLLTQLRDYGDYLDEHIEAHWTSSASLGVVRRDAEPGMAPTSRHRPRGRRPRRMALLVACAAVLFSGLLAYAFLRSEPTAPSRVEAPGDSSAAACIPVQDHGGTPVGCVRATDLSLPPAAANAVFSLHGGYPVYAAESSSTVVGAQVPDVGFVPTALVANLARIRSCTEAVRSASARGTMPSLDSACRAMLAQLGYSAQELGDVPTAP